jgi:hypothetical protein
MLQNDKGSTGGIRGSAGTAEGLHALNIADIVVGLVKDLEGLRSGAVTIPQARARSQLAHEIFRGINLVIVGQRIIEGNARMLNAPSAPPKKRGNGRGRVIDG